MGRAGACVGHRLVRTNRKGPFAREHVGGGRTIADLERAAKAGELEAYRCGA